MSAPRKLARDVVDHGIVIVAVAVRDGASDDEAARAGLELLARMSDVPLPAKTRTNALEVYRMVAAAARGEGFAVPDRNNERGVNNVRTN